MTKVAKMFNEEVNMRIKPEIDYKNLSEQQAKALKILNERLRKKEKEMSKLNQQMASLRRELRENTKEKELRERIAKAIGYINKHKMQHELMDEFEYISTSPKRLLAILMGDVDEL
jgi:hypothetical protein